MSAPRQGRKVSSEQKNESDRETDREKDRVEAVGGDQACGLAEHRPGGVRRRATGEDLGEGQVNWKEGMSPGVFLAEDTVRT